MSLNHLEFDLAVQELRDEAPFPEQRQRGLERVLSRRRRSPKLPLAVGAAAVVVGLSLLPLVSRRGGGYAWAEVLRRTEGAENVHCVTYNAAGQPVGELWRSGVMRASWGRGEDGRIRFEDRCDKWTFYSFVYWDSLKGPNARQFAWLWDVTPQMLEGMKRFSRPRMVVEDFMNTRRTHLVRQERVEVDGRTLQRYVLLMYGKDLETVEADPGSGRILTIRSRFGETCRYEYPETVDASVFSYRSRISRDVIVFDRRGHPDPQHEPPFMPPVIQAKGGIQLRKASVSTDGTLYVYWTGHLPDKNEAKRLRILGTRTGRVKWLGYYKDGIHPVTGPHAKRLVCYRVELPEKVGDKITIRVPWGPRIVEFRDISLEKPQPFTE